MFKKILFPLIIILYFSIPRISISQFAYIGIGGDYGLPLGDFSGMNKSSFGVNLQLEFRQICELWYGARFDYIPYQQQDTATNYFKDAFYFSPNIKFNILGSLLHKGGIGEYSNRFLPYLEALLTLSAIGGTDEENRLGLGAGLGAGIVYNFHLFRRCASLDLNAIYSSPNFILKSEKRKSLQNVIISLSLSICI
jgi:hypothetical protein